MQKLRLNLPLLLPEMEKRDACTRLLVDRLANVRGVEEAHIVRENGTAQLCLHYDPNLVSLERLRRIAESSGIAVTERYRHEQMPFAGLDAADAADVLAERLEKLPGMLHASVNYAAGLIFVAYDSEALGSHYDPKDNQWLRRTCRRSHPRTGGGGRHGRPNP